MECKGCKNRGRIKYREKDIAVFGNPDASLARLNDDLCEGGKKLLISQDAFGQHLATAARFDDEFVECASHAELEDSVVDYYANILMPFGQLIKAKISEIQKLGLEIDMIAPDHGIIWRKQPRELFRCIGIWRMEGVSQGCNNI